MKPYHKEILRKKERGENMKEKLIDLLAKGKGLEVHQITAAIPNDSLTEIMKAIHALMEEGIIIEDEEHFYHLLENSPYRIGTLRLHERGFGFVDIDDGGESIYIHQNHLECNHHYRLLPSHDN